MARKPVIVSAVPDPLVADNVVDIAAALGAPVDAPAFADPDAERGADPSDRQPDSEADRPHLPKDAPITALGVNGGLCYYLSARGQIHVWTGRDHSKNNFIQLFTPFTQLPHQYWPQWSAPIAEKIDKNTGVVLAEAVPSRITGFKQDHASEALIGACGDAGIFDAFGRVRERGSYYGQGGALILHLGDMVMVCGRRANGEAAKPVFHQCGVIDGMVYPCDTETVARPHAERVGTDAGEAMEALLKTWNWDRAELDPRLMLGAVAQAFIGGAPLWRSHVMISGGAGTGKSTLNGKDQVLDRLFGHFAVRSANATEAAVRQRLRAKTIVVIFDEFETTELNGGKLQAILELSRISSSGDNADKGTADQKGQSYTLRSPFIFSAILPPRLKPQDQGRFALLELRPLRPDTPKLNLDALDLPTLGRKLMRRMIQGWPRYAETLAAYRGAFAAKGHTPRAQDTYGTLLACADLLLYDHVPDPELLAHWADVCAPAALREVAEATSEHEDCLNHLKTVMVQAMGGEERVPMGRWIERAIEEVVEPREDERGRAVRKHRDRLTNYGLKLVTVRRTRSGNVGAREWVQETACYLAVANSGVALNALFAGTRWSGGTWAIALGRVDGVQRPGKIAFGAAKLNAVCVPIGAVVAGDDDGGSAADDEPLDDDLGEPCL